VVVQDRKKLHDENIFANKTKATCYYISLIFELRMLPTWLKPSKKSTKVWYYLKGKRTACIYIKEE